MPKESEEQDAGQDSRSDGGSFPETRWTLVVRATDRSQDTIAFQAMSSLFEAYRAPLLAFLLRSGASREDAEDTVQGFLAVVNEKRYMDAAEESKGRLRTFLLDALKKYRAKEYRASRAQKRGGHAGRISIDETNEDGIAVFEPADTDLTPEAAFDRQWALTFLEKVVQRLQQEYGARSKEEEFGLLKPYLTPGGDGLPYREVASRLGITENNVKVRVKRLRDRYRQLLETEVAETLDATAGISVNDELSSLLQALG